jgi:plastocyanin
MSNWDLMMPGMGLTAIGLTGVTISYMGLAHTFIDGMHALTGLTMFIGLIFLAAGILDGGVSTSNRAKATVLVIASISLGFGMYAFTLNTIESTNIIAGLLIAIAFPAIVIAYVAAKMPTRIKPIGSIVALAAATGIISFVAFGFVSPDTYIIAEEIIEVEEAELTGPIFPITILVNSAVQGNPDYDPDVAYVPKGHLVEWANADSFAHTVTSSEDVGETFDSGLLNEGEKFLLDTRSGNSQEGPNGVFDSDLIAAGDSFEFTFTSQGNEDYYCIVHPWMTGSVEVG